ncbi:uncharacterized protein [Primulina huaijiensis]|uniref:uncharacterized protein n=1 Tax=Primulina huaijiensis TaxID=1492673 RepID=UPI003CC7065D
MQCNLQDIQMKGHPFTWEKGRGKTHFVEEKLDRALASTSWAARFPEASVANTVETCSDHSPILLVTEGQVTNLGSISFRFENRWMEEEDFISTVTDMWATTTTSETITNKLKVLSTALIKWSKKQPKVNRKSIEELKTMINRMRSFTYMKSLSTVEEMK